MGDYKMYHVLCSRVVDRWNLESKAHGIGHCYYGYEDQNAVEEKASKLLFPTRQETLGAALTNICEWSGLQRRRGGRPSSFFPGTDPESAWDQQMDRFVVELATKHGAAEP